MWAVLTPASATLTGRISDLSGAITSGAAGNRPDSFPGFVAQNHCRKVTRPLSLDYAVLITAP